MKIQDIMTTHVTTAKSDSTVRELWKLLFSKHVNAMPVVDKKNHLLGIITKEDLLKELYPNYQEYFADIGTIDDFEAMEGKVKELGNIKAADIMCTHVVYTRADTPIMRALSRMIVRRINQLPVISEKDEVIGMVTKGDVFYALVNREINSKKSIVQETPVEKKKVKKSKKLKKIKK
jgi:CBS-domain-containing membrane protein